MFTELMASGSGGGGSNGCSILFANYGANFPSAQAYKRSDFDDIATLTGEGTNTLTFTFKKNVKGSVTGSGLSNTLGGTATFDASPVIEFSTNPPKHNGTYAWNFETTAGQTLIFACGGGWSQHIFMTAND